tara:strand:+ start:287 stop:547 length:261 start_codon:yes stop_codon:yes gene_type:complete
MPNITVVLTDTQNKCMEYAAADVQDWADNALHNRARIAQDEIIAKLVAHCNENSISIATGVNAQVTQAYTLGVVKTAKQLADEIEA